MASSEQIEQLNRRSPDLERPNLSMLRIVLVGKTGAGKSSSGNTILGRKAFRAAQSGTSVTKECWKETGVVAGVQLEVVDNPGLFDDSLSEKDLRKEISKCISLMAPGPHVIIMVIQPGPLTAEEQLAMEKIRAFFGEEAEKHTMILFTHKDELTGSVEDLLMEAEGNIKPLLEVFGGRYHVLDNTKIDDREQVVEFLDKVEKLVIANGRKHYTSPMFQEAEEKLKEKEEELKKHYSELEIQVTSRHMQEIRLLEEQIKRLKESGEEQEKIIQQLKDVIIKKNRQLDEYRRFYQMKYIRAEAEQTDINENTSAIVYARIKRVKYL